MGGQKNGHTSFVFFFQNIIESLLDERVKATGRLVHNQEVRIAGEHLRKRNPFDFASRELAHSLPGFQAEFVENALGPELVLEIGSVHYLLLYGLERVVFEFLLQEGNAHFLEELDAAAGVGLVLACKDSHQRGLARAVRSDKGDFVAFVYVEGNIFEEYLGAVALGDVFYLQI